MYAPLAGRVAALVALTRNAAVLPVLTRSPRYLSSLSTHACPRCARTVVSARTHRDAGHTPQSIMTHSDSAVCTPQLHLCPLPSLINLHPARSSRTDSPTEHAEPPYPCTPRSFGHPAKDARVVSQSCVLPARSGSSGAPIPSALDLRLRPHSKRVADTVGELHTHRHLSVATRAPSAATGISHMHERDRALSRYMCA